MTMTVTSKSPTKRLASSRKAQRKMAPVKDMRRQDLIVPYQEPAATGDKGDLSSTVATTMPMAAMFTRNKFIGWAAVVFSIQSWLGESEEARKSGGTPGYFTVLMSVMALGVTYLPLVLPPAVSGPAASGTSAPLPVPPR
ncbi:family UPF0139 [Ophiocordyceps camponoti-floridani]|uniref:Family UPF0139 n=1 Tax=Ophiocordyceps camponoti-floridani TaxID=2030778 RepID=A0A8H4VEG1_9HYPO|nr:family UPF0139 [Ophiocordyceps camponoti-floridani]